MYKINCTVKNNKRKSSTLCMTIISALAFSILSTIMAPNVTYADNSGGFSLFGDTKGGPGGNGGYSVLGDTYGGTDGNGGYSVVGDAKGGPGGLGGLSLLGDTSDGIVNTSDKPASDKPATDKPASDKTET